MFVPLCNKPRRSQSIVGQTRAEHEIAIAAAPCACQFFVFALVYLAEHMLGSLRFSPKNPSLLFALCNGNDAHPSNRSTGRAGALTSYDAALRISTLKSLATG
jgi:hypothetical protein